MDNKCMRGHKRFEKKLQVCQGSSEEAMRRYVGHFPSALEEIRALTDEFYDYGCEKRRGQIARNVEKHDRPRATSDDVPERVCTLMDGSNYLQYSNSGLYIYYLKETIKVADG
ncbi:hypothetical protein ANCDUO_14301 [Ancylostoma duodenale]|uniref:Uncharacterized protein n=1 Tax=Ancylostoma duodenale TaxID=51022 RepID=A0A0C2D0H1_9BILA|nr:hypothetical protein ANCDUO_14301 [Ancylostoma duodenale]